MMCKQTGLVLQLRPSLFYQAINTRPFLQSRGWGFAFLLLVGEECKGERVLSHWAFRLWHLKELIHSLGWATVLAQCLSGGFPHRDFAEREISDLSLPKLGPTLWGLWSL